MRRTEKFEEKKRMIVKERGAECKEMRKSYNLSQQTVAERIGVSQDLISKFERGVVDSVSIYCLYVETVLKLRYEN